MIYSANVIINFNNMGLTSVPVANITADATHIRIGNNPFVTIPNNTFAGLGLTVLHEINLDSTQLTDKGLNRDSFVGLENAKAVGSINLSFLKAF